MVTGHQENVHLSSPLYLSPFILPRIADATLSDWRWHQHIARALNGTHPHLDNSVTDGGVPAVGSDFFSACFENFMKKDEVDIVFVEVR